MHRPKPPLLPLLALMTGACANLVDPSPPQRTPLIEAMLTAGTAVTEVRIGWLSAGQPDRREALPADVAVQIEDNAGHAAQLEPGSGPGLFVAHLNILAGVRYSLHGTVGGVAVHASTTVPANFNILAPAGDTLRLRPEGTTTAGPYRTLPFQWSSVGATTFALESAYVVPTASETTALSGQLLVFGNRLRVVAMNRDLAGYLYRRPAETNISGGFGTFGGAVASRKEIVWE